MTTLCITPGTAAGAGASGFAGADIGFNFHGPKTCEEQEGPSVPIGISGMAAAGGGVQGHLNVTPTITDTNTGAGTIEPGAGAGAGAGVGLGIQVGASGCYTWVHKEGCDPAKVAMLRLKYEASIPNVMVTATPITPDPEPTCETLRRVMRKKPYHLPGNGLTR